MENKRNLTKLLATGAITLGLGAFTALSSGCMMPPSNRPSQRIEIHSRQVYHPMPPHRMGPAFSNPTYTGHGFYNPRHSRRTSIYIGF